MTIEEELKKAVSKAEKDLRTAIENRPFDKHLLSAYGIKYNDACLEYDFYFIGYGAKE